MTPRSALRKILKAIQQLEEKERKTIMGMEHGKEKNLSKILDTQMRSGKNHALSV